MAQQAAAPMQPRTPDDDNVARRWLLAQALGEAAQVHAQAGDASAAAQAAAAALVLWRVVSSAGERAPPALQRWVDPLSTLVVR